MVKNESPNSICCMKLKTSQKISNIVRRNLMNKGGKQSELSGKIILADFLEYRNYYKYTGKML